MLSVLSGAKETRARSQSRFFQNSWDDELSTAKFMCDLPYHAVGVCFQLGRQSKCCRLVRLACGRISSSITPQLQHGRFYTQNCQTVSSPEHNPTAKNRAVCTAKDPNDRRIRTSATLTHTQLTRAPADQHLSSRNVGEELSGRHNEAKTELRTDASGHATIVASAILTRHK